MTTPTAAPCLSCRTTRGFIRADRRTPVRVLGLCNACYKRARFLGVIALYPACGERPVERKRRGYRNLEPTIPTAIVPAAALGWPDQPALTLTTWPMDLLCARLDRPHWETVAWNWCPRDPGFAAYHDADTAQQAAA